jgi:hypothetical protein
MTSSEVRWAVVATVLFGAGGAAQLAGAPPPLWWVLYLACYAAGGWEPALSALRALRERTLDVDLLMVVAALLAAAIGQVFDGALLIVIFATSGALEAFVTRRTAESVQALLRLAPERATRLHADGSEEAVETAELAVGDLALAGQAPRRSRSRSLLARTGPARRGRGADGRRGARGRRRGGSGAQLARDAARLPPPIDPRPVRHARRYYRP